MSVIIIQQNLKTGIEALKYTQRRILHGSMCDIFSNINAK